MDIRKLSQNIQEETGKIIVGKSDRIRLIVMSILANGHILLDDLPGVGKTTLVKTISIALGCQSGRIQFVPDLLPSDIIGMRIYNQKTGDFELRQGPVMTNLLLADEINRAIPRTQSALLEAMVRPVTNAQELVEAQRQISQVHLSDAVADYIVALAAATRSHPQLKMGASPRATRGLYRAAKVWAAMEGRDFVTPDDVKTLAAPVLEHRLILDSGARFSGVSVSAILDDVLERLQGAPELEAVAHEK